MADVVAVDVGTSTTKLSRRAADGVITTERVARTPVKPIDIVQTVDKLIRAAEADIVALSSFRRALVIDDDTLVLARSSPAEPIVRPESDGTIDALNPVAPIHRWVDSVRLACPRFLTFDVWLAERLTGRSVCAESLAWLTGAWDTVRGAWDERTCVAAMLAPEQLPDVLSEPFIVGRVCLPVLGDHEATALACARAGEWPLRLAECGTALACLIGGNAEIPPRLGLESPIRCGYSEWVDPHFAQRIAGKSPPAPAWMPNTRRPSARDVVIAAFRRHPEFNGPILMCGGSATQKLLEDLNEAGFDASVDTAYTSSAGALILAERAASARAARRPIRRPPEAWTRP